jgi:hypothetical protein
MVQNDSEKPRFRRYLFKTLTLTRFLKNRNSIFKAVIYRKKQGTLTKFLCLKTLSNTKCKKKFNKYLF